MQNTTIHTHTKSHNFELTTQYNMQRVSVANAAFLRAHVFCIHSPIHGSRDVLAPPTFALQPLPLIGAPGESVNTNAT